MPIYASVKRQKEIIGLIENRVTHQNSTSAPGIGFVEALQSYSLLFHKQKSPTSVDFMLRDTSFLKLFSLFERRKNKWLSRNVVLAGPACTWYSVLFGNKHACLIERLEQAENKFPALCTPVVSGFILIHFTAASVLSLIVRARTVHTQTISLLGRIDLVTTSSGRNRWGRRKGTLWGKEDR